MPAATGTASTDFGTGADYDFLFSFDGPPLLVDVAGLEPSSSYRLLVTYLNNDTGSSTQLLSLADGDLVHDGLSLPSGRPTTYGFVLPKNGFASGSLSLQLARLSGARTVFQHLFIVEQPSVDSTPPTISLDSPTDGSALNASNLQVTGTASDDGDSLLVEVGLTPTGGVTDWRPVSEQAGANGPWTQLLSNLAEGSYSLQARATDAAGNRALSPSVQISMDRTAPQPVQALLAEPVGGGVRLLWLGSVSETDGDVSEYRIRRAQSALGPFIDAGSAPAGSDRFDDTGVSLNQDYFYTVVTVDAAGNETSSPVSGPVTTTTAADTTAPEDVTGLSVEFTTAGGTGLALLRWTGSANSAGDLTGYRLRISTDGGASVDQSIDIERTESTYLLDGLTLGTEYTLTLVALDEVPNVSAGQTVTGTPTGASDQLVSFSGTLPARLHLDGGVYRFTGNVVVPAGGVLHLGPGTIIKVGAGVEIQVEGALISQGSAAEPVVFTAWTDDSVGGDSNGDGGASSPQPGYWRQLEFMPGSAGAGSGLTHTLIRYAGTSNNVAVYLNQSPVDLDHVQITDSQYIGLYVYRTNAVISDSLLADNGSHGVQFQDFGTSRLERTTIARNAASGVYVYSNAYVTYRDNQIVDNAEWGIYYRTTGDAPPLTGNVITGNNWPLIVPASALPDATNTLTPNARAYIALRGGVLPDNAVLRRWAVGTADEIRTYINYSSNLEVGTNRRLRVEPGVVVKFGENHQFTVNGSIDAQGSAEQRIAFTSVHDDLHGGDINLNGLATLPRNGDWQGLWLNDSVLEAENVLSFADVTYAGSNGWGNVTFYRSAGAFDNATVSNSSTVGIYVYESSPRIRGNRIWGNASDGIYVQRMPSAPIIEFNRISSNLRDGVRVDNTATAVVTNNELLQNRQHGLLNNTGSLIDATQNWWGDVDGSGPQNAGGNPAGTGQPVSDNVDFSNFLTIAPIDFLYSNFSTAGVQSEGSLPAPTLVQGTLSNEWGSAPDRSMVWDANEVIVDLTGLDPNARYVLRTSLFNADVGDSLQSIVDADGNPIVTPISPPENGAFQYEFPIPAAYIASGDLRLRVVNDTPATAIRSAMTEFWLFQDEGQLAPPLFDAVAYNDVDGSGDLSAGDQFVFSFSEAVDTTLVSGGNDADLHMPAAGASYGTPNTVAWSTDARHLTVTLSAGFTVVGDEVVTPTGLTSPEGLDVAGARSLTTIDTIAPTLSSLEWDDADGSGEVSSGDRYTFHFDEAMAQSAIRDGTGDANAALRPAGGRRYGIVNTVQWAADGRSVSVTLSSGFNVVGNELVTPSLLVTDLAGNAVQGSVVLQGLDTTAPTLTGALFNDADGNGAVSIGDSYTFVFSEPMKQTGLSDGSIEANLNLSPAGKRYGTTNNIVWNADGTRATVLITPGFNVTGTETVTPSGGLTDLSGNPLTGSLNLDLTDVMAPRVASVVPNFSSPLPATNGYRLTVQFDSAMDTSVPPQLTLSSSGTQQPVVPTAGVWATTVYPNDTWMTAAIALTQGMDGSLSLSVDGASDRAGNPMLGANDVFQTLLDATPPANPMPTLASLGCSTARLSWNGYADPGDVAGFQVYLAEAASISTADGVSFNRFVPGNARQVAVGPLSLDTQYAAAVAAIDQAGNRDPAVSSVAFRIDYVVPPPVPVTAVQGPTSDSVRIGWSSYATGNLCGFAGFRVYLEENSFSDVTGLTPLVELGAGAREHLITGLDRARTYHVAVVGFNSRNELQSAVTPVQWSDPFAGEITVDTTIGSADEKIVDIDRTIVIRNGATVTIAAGTTLRFAPGAGIEAENGRIVADGTPLEPIVLTSAADLPGGTPAAGDWAGVLITAGDTGSLLRHVFVRYGSGVVVDDATPVIDALTARFNAGPGLWARNGADLVTSDAWLAFNDVGVLAQSGANVVIDHSVIKTNTSHNAQTDTTGTVDARGNWWGALDLVGIAPTVSGNVDVSGFLGGEPVLTPAAALATGQAETAVREVPLRLAGRLADEVRVSEDPGFAGAFYQPFEPELVFQLSPNAGAKTIHLQMRSVTGVESSVLQLPVQYIAEDPAIDSVSVSAGQTLGRPLTLQATASSPLGIALTEIFVDGVPFTSAAGSSASARWDIRSGPTGPRVVLVRATDSVGNFTEQSIPVSVVLQAPPAPSLSLPVDATITNTALASVAGNAEPLVDITVRRNGQVVASGQSSDTGSFQFTGIALTEGSNQFLARASDSVGVSPSSNGRSVILDTGAPAAPMLTSAIGILGTGIRLTWDAPVTGEVPASYNVYRSTGDFSTPASATLIRQGLSISEDFIDDSRADGTFFYRLASVDSAGNLSPLSNSLSASYDGTRPAFTIAFNGSSPVGPSALGITLTANEPLDAKPVLTVRTARSSGPLPIALTQVNETTFTGTFQVLPATPSGPLSWSVSATDLFGNTFVGAPTGPALVLDTDGPVASVAIGATQPVQVLGPETVSLSVTLDESVKPATTPTLRYQPPAGAEVAIALIGSGASWTGLLNLDPSMGQGTGQFVFDAIDALDNASSEIAAGASLELYNTDFPDPASAPTGLDAQPLAGGRIRLSWPMVSDADGYSVYRSNGDCSTAPDELVATDVAGGVHEDTPPLDQQYCYHVTSLRLGAESTASPQASALADRLAPDAAESVLAELASAGVRVSWSSAAGGDPATRYRVERNGQVVRTLAVNGAAPGSAFQIVDHPASGGIWNYTVYAIDTIGNEQAAPAASFELLVGAVSDLRVLVEEGSAPVLTWSASDPQVTAFEVRRGSQLLTASPIVENTFADNAYSGTQVVEYSVQALNADGDRSPPRTVTVYPLLLSSAVNPDQNGIGTSFTADTFSRIALSVLNQSTEPAPVTGYEVQVTRSVDVLFDRGFTQSTEVAAGETLMLSTAVPVENDTEQRLVRFTLRAVDPDAGEVVYRSYDLFDTGFSAGQVVLSTAEVPLAGGLSSVRTCYRNGGGVPVDLVVYRDNGDTAGDIRVALLDSAGLELSAGVARGVSGGGLFVEGGTGYVTIAPAAERCFDVEVLVPAELEPGTDLEFVGGPTQLFQDYRGARLLLAGPIQGSMLSGYVEAPYYGTASTDKAAYANNETVTITGQAIDRASGDPLPDTLLRFGFLVDGFKWYQGVTTDASGNYQIDYRPPAGVSGRFTVWAAHPDVLDTLNQASFDFYRMYSQPARASINASKADTLDFQIKLINPGALPIAGLSGEFRAYTIAPDGSEVDEPTVSGGFSFPDPAQVPSGGNLSIPLTLTAAVDAPDNVNVEYRFISADGAVATVEASVSLKPAIPILRTQTPRAGYVDVSVNAGEIVTATVTVENEGLDALRDAVLIPPQSVPWMSVSLPANPDGSISLGDIGVGEQLTFDVTFAAPADQPLGYVNDTLRITGANEQQTYELGLFALVTTSSIGNARFVVYDIAGRLVPNARIDLRNPLLNRELSGIVTDENGVALIEDLEVGEWSYRTIARGHTTVTGVVDIVADQTVLVEPEMYRSFVTVNFRVEPVAFTDRYEIKIEQTFVTNVPVPVLVADPPVTRFGYVEPGFEATVIVKLSNKGLKALDDVTLKGQESPSARWEPLITYLPRIDAQETIEIPFRFQYFGENANPGLPGGSLSDTYDDWQSCMDASLTLNGADIANGLVALMGGFTSSALSGRLQPVQATAATEFEVKFPTCDLLQDACKDAGSNAVGGGEIADYVADKACEKALEGLSNSPPCKLLDKLKKAFDIGRGIGCALVALGLTEGGGCCGGGGAPGGVGGYGVGGPGCFAAGTPILMADGSTRPIESIAPGDEVMNFEGGMGLVSRVHRQPSDHIRELLFETLIVTPVGGQTTTASAGVGRLQTTDEHHFWVDTIGWVRASELEVGQVLILDGNRRARITENWRRELPEQSVVYNLDVEGYASFFANGVLARQECGDVKKLEVDDAIRRFLEGAK
ncbi:MAG: right-handed parallel beta-helix repeat-containing protein [Gammaproteobacteria bacterium]|nr:right-handed parallel beta-helix repeat-containing protein [Gammaproteobacteria bacterium]